MKLKKAMCFLLSSMILLSVSGCQKKQEQNSVDSLSENKYKAKNITIPNDLQPWQVKFTDSEVILFDTNGSGLTMIDYEGKIQSDISLPQGEWISCFDKTADGSYFAISSKYKEESDSISEMNFIKLDASGTKTDSFEIDMDTFGKNEADAYAAGLLVDDAGNFYVQSSHVVYVFDKNGKYLFESAPADKNKDTNDVYTKSVFRLKDGRIASNSWEYVTSTNQFFAIINIFDIENKSTKEYRIDTTDLGNDCIASTGIKYDMLISTNMGIYEYELETGSKTGIMNCLDYGIDVKNLAGYKLFPNGDIVCAVRDENWVINGITRYIKLDPSDANTTEKKTITIATLSADYWLSTYISDFNKNSEEYKIELKSYMEGASDSAEALKKFNTDIIAGNVPDIIARDLLNPIPATSYINKGLYADLYEFMDKDPSFNKDDYLTNAFTALENDGKLYEIFPMYMIETVAAKTSDVGNETGWTLDKFAEFLDTKPNASYIIDDYTKKDIIGKLVTNIFVDPKTNECHFDRAEFEKILKIAERFPANELGSDVNYSEFIMGCRNGDPVLSRIKLYRLNSIKEIEVFQMGEPMTFKGFPAPYGNGSYFQPCGLFAISSKAENPDGAWNFIKYMLDEYKDDYKIYLPLKRSALEKLANEAMDTNPENEREVTFNTGDSAPITLKVDANTAEDNAKVMRLIESTVLVRNVDATLSSIINEEIGAYLSGQKTVDEVIDIIENRVNLYINEMK